MPTGVEGVIGKLKNPEFRAAALSGAIDKHTGIFSMSRRPDSILQWSYYRLLISAPARELRDLFEESVRINGFAR